MKQQAVLVIAGAVVGLAALAQPARAQVTSCPNSNACVQVKLTPASVSGTKGGTVTVGVEFTQAPNDGQAGGPDEIAALALTIGLGNNGTPLTLANCTLTPDGLPGAVHAMVSNFKVVVENVSCANGRTHCLCPDPVSGITADNFINLVVYGPDPLPTPGPNPIDIPTLPAGPQQLLSIDLTVGATASGTIPLHIYNQVQDNPQHPQFTAVLSVGDKVAVDQTCVPAAGQPPCSTIPAVSQVATTDGAVTVGAPCTGDCDGSGDVDVTEIIKMVNIALGSAPVSDCTAGDANGDGTIDVTEIISAVNHALNGCPTS